MTNTISSKALVDQAIGAIQNQQIQLSDTQAQLASGRRINRASDSPVEAAEALKLRSNINFNEQYITNIANARESLNLEEIQLKDMQTILQRIRGLAIQTGNKSFTNTDLEGTHTELEQLLQQLVGIANTKHNDDYLFSGFKAKQIPVALENNSYVYKGDLGQKSLQIGPSVMIPVTDNGRDIFFTIAAANTDITASSGQTIVTSSNGLVNTATLTTLDATALIINNFAIPATQASDDTLSSTGNAGSAIAIAASINSTTTDTGVVATVNANSINLGTFTAGVLAGNNLVINGVAIVDAVGTEASVMTAINDTTDSTGVVATQPGGAGTAILLTASDGRNIRLEIDGTAAVANFSNVSLAAASDRIQRSTITLNDSAAISIAGANPSYGGLVAGSYSVTANGGNATISTPIIVGVDTNVDDLPPSEENYLIKFTSATTYSIYAESSPHTPLTDFTDVTYTSGEAITFNGIEVTITGTPNTNDVFTVSLEPVAYQDVFTTVQDLKDSLTSEFRLDANRPHQFSYFLGVTLKNLDYALENISKYRSTAGSRLNNLQYQEDNNKDMVLFTKETLATLEDLDYTKAIGDFYKIEQSMQAGMLAFVQMQRTSIFNYM